MEALRSHEVEQVEEHSRGTRHLVRVERSYARRKRQAEVRVLREMYSRSCSMHWAWKDMRQDLVHAHYCRRNEDGRIRN